MGFAGSSEAPRLAVFQRLPGQGPADGAVAQGGHRVGDAGVDQGLGADDAAGASGAVDDNAGCRVRCQLAGAQHQLRPRHADATGNAHGLVFVETPGVEHHHVSLAVEQGLDFFRRQGRRMPLAFHQFAEGLAWHIDVDKQLATGAAPALQATFEQADVAVAQRLQALRGAVRQAFAIVIEGDWGIAPGNARIHLQLQFRQRDIGGKQRMPLGEGRLFAHIDEGQLFTVQQRLADLRVGAGRCCAHRAWLSLDRSQILGRKALE